MKIPKKKKEAKPIMHWRGKDYYGGLIVPDELKEQAAVIEEFIKKNVAKQM